MHQQLFLLRLLARQSDTARPDKKNVEDYRELQALQDETSAALREVFAKHRKFVLRD